MKKNSLWLGILTLFILCITGTFVSAASMGNTILTFTITPLYWIAIAIMFLIVLYFLTKLAAVVVPFLLSNWIGWVILGIVGVILIGSFVVLLMIANGGGA